MRERNANLCILQPESSIIVDNVFLVWCGEEYKDEFLIVRIEWIVGTWKNNCSNSEVVLEEAFDGCTDCK